MKNKAQSNYGEKYPIKLKYQGEFQMNELNLRNIFMYVCTLHITHILLVSMHTNIKTKRIRLKC